VEPGNGFGFGASAKTSPGFWQSTRWRQKDHLGDATKTFRPQGASLGGVLKLKKARPEPGLGCWVMTGYIT
jgi:hypothetical protein